MPPPAGKRMIQASNGKGLGASLERNEISYHAAQAEPRHAARSSLHPDQRRHATALAITPVREESRCVRVRAPTTAEDVSDAEGDQPPPREGVQIALPPPPRVGFQ